MYENRDPAKQATPSRYESDADPTDLDFQFLDARSGETDAEGEGTNSGLPPLPDGREPTILSAVVDKQYRRWVATPGQGDTKSRAGDQETAPATEQSGREPFEGEFVPADWDNTGSLDEFVYRDVARASRGLTGMEFRTLDALTTCADWAVGARKRGDQKAKRIPLGNCFPSIAVIAKKIGRSQTQAKRLLKQLVEKGWLRTHPLQRRNGGRRATNLYQFCIPPGETAPDEPGWAGPVHYPNCRRFLRVVPYGHKFRGELGNE